MRKRLLAAGGALILALILLASLVGLQAFPLMERPDHFRDGNVVSNGKVYAPPPSEEAFEASAIEDGIANARFSDTLRALGHFYCSRKIANPAIPSGVYYPPAFLSYISSDLSAWWLRWAEGTHDSIAASRQGETSAAWRRLGGYPADMSADEVTSAYVAMSISEWTLCPDGYPNSYAGKDYRPGVK